MAALELHDRSFAYWDDGHPDLDRLMERLGANHMELPPSGWQTQSGWWVDPGSYQLHIGRSSADMTHVMTVEVAE